jgi:hypothetical protein
LSHLLPVLLALAATLAGCAHVAPYEREELACDCMTSPRTGQYDTFEGHARSSREGASATGWSAGGGCGCN